jgi:hypothetical protein
MRLIGSGLTAVIAACLSAALLSGGAGSAGAASCETVADFGSVLTQSDIDTAVKALPAEALLGKRGKPVKTPAPRVMLGNLPAVAQQGSPAQPGYPGTCEAQSYGYGLGTYTAARTSTGGQKWQARLAQNSVSAAYLYALVQKRAQKQCPDGSRSLDYLEQLAGEGGPSAVQVPYQSNCTYLNGINVDPRPNMARFRIGSYAVIRVGGNPGAVTAIKSQVQAGHAVAFTGLVLCNYALSPTFKSGVLYETSTVPNSGHGQLIVGYDDKVGKKDQRGALLVQNSFGIGWPPASANSAAPPGQAYWSYGSFSTTQAMAAVAYPVADSLGNLRLSASVTNATIGSVSRSYQWTPRTDDKSVYLIIDLAFAGPVKLREVWLTEPGGAALQVKSVYGQHISSGYAYLKRSDGKSFLAGKYKLTLKTGEAGDPAITYTGHVKVKSLKKAGTLTPASMSGVTITGPTGAAVLTN